MENQMMNMEQQAQEVTLFTNFEKLAQMSDYLCKSDILPETFKGKPANVFIALDMAQRMGMNPFMVCQNIYMVHGRPAWSSSFLIACINACGKFSNLDFEFRNDAKKGGLGCRAIATRLSDGKRLEGSWVTMQMANAEGWTKKNGSKWLTMPEQMLRYRAASFWQRIFAPEVAMGLRDEDEVRDMQPAVIDIPATEVKNPQPLTNTMDSQIQEQLERMKAAQAAEEGRSDDGSEEAQAEQPLPAEKNENGGAESDGKNAAEVEKPEAAEGAPAPAEDGYLFGSAAEYEKAQAK